MDDERIDFSALDPTRDDTAFNARVTAIGRDAMAARLRGPDLFAVIANWTAPALIAATLVLALAVPALTRSRKPPAAPASAADVLGIPPRLAELMRSPAPSLDDLHAALNAGSP